MIIALAGCGGKKINTIATTDISKPIADVTQAAKDSLNTLGFDIQKTEVHRVDTQIFAKHPDGQSAWVELDKDKESQTHIKVKVDTEGKPDVSAKEIIKDIKVRY